MKTIQFTYDDDLEVKSCTRPGNGSRIPKLAASVLFKLWHAKERELSKEEVVTFVWGRHDNYVRRSFDVHLIKVRKFIEGTGYEIDTSKHGLICLRREADDLL